MNVGQWHHAAVTYDGECWQLYLDGWPETDGRNCPKVEPAYESEFITGFAAALDYNARLLGRFAGLLDEVRIWERALSAEEILRNMHSQVERAPGLIGRWSLDEVEGIVFNDSTGNEHWGGVHDARLELWDVADLEGGVCVHLAPASTD